VSLVGPQLAAAATHVMGWNIILLVTLELFGDVPSGFDVLPPLVDPRVMLVLLTDLFLGLWTILS
jgi:hypothetical protein